MRVLLALLTAFGLLIVFLLLKSGPIDPVIWQPAPNPGLVSPFAPNNKLDGISEVLKGHYHGPEDIAQASDGSFFTGLHDGRIVQFNADGEHRVVAQTGGRPLGLQVDHSGDIIIADAHKGLLRLNANGDISVLVDEYKGRKLRFVDDLDIAADGTIWFSDVSMRYSVEDTFYDLLEGSASGRLFSYHPATGELKLHLSDLFFANGVALGPDDRFVLVNETGRGTIVRLWLKGEQAGTRDIFYNGLPGHPDNLSFNGKDTFWIALPSLRSSLFDQLANWPMLRKLLAHLPESLQPADPNSSMIVGLGVDGSVKYNLQSETGHYHYITSVNQYGDRLYIGSLVMDAVATLAVPVTQ